MDTETKDLLLEIRNKLEIIEFFIPPDIALVELARVINQKSKTVYRYLRDNFEPEVDYYKNSGKILVGKETALCIRRHYAKR